MDSPKWKNGEQLLGIPSSLSPNYLCEAFMALVFASTFYRLHHYLSTFKMDYQKIKGDSIRPTCWYWNHCASNGNSCHLGCYLLFFGHKGLIRRASFGPFNLCTFSGILLLLYLLISHQHQRWTWICYVDKTYRTNWINVPQPFQDTSPLTRSLPHLLDDQLWRNILLLRSRWHLLLE